MQQKTRFGLKVLLLLSPFSIIVIIYFVFDPFMVLRSYKRFDHTHVMLNEAYVGWQNYMANRDSLRYNSFIMGNSCTMAFKVETWEKFIGKGNRAVRFYDTGESLGGLCQKLCALDSVAAPLKNVLIVVNRNLLKDVHPMEDNGHLFSAEAANITPLAFQMSFLQKFLNPKVALPYIKYLITHKYSSSMKGIINPGPPIREPYTNNFINPRERDIELKGERYWLITKAEFKERVDAGKEEERCIFREQVKLLRRIKAVCSKHGTNLIFILEPDYYQKRMNAIDVKMLKSILGASAVWDFSGVNRFTSDIHNYYEPGHFRPTVGEEILTEIYKDKK